MNDTMNTINTMSNVVHISDAARILAVSTKTLRRWETKGILKSQRSPTGYRIYNSEDLYKIKNGFTIKPKHNFKFNGNFLKIIAITVLLIITTAIAVGVIFKGETPFQGETTYQGGNSLTSSDPVMQGRNLTEVVLAAATDSVSDFVFSVAVPALFKNNVVFEESVKFKKAISAPNIVTSVNDKTGKVTLELTAGSGISVSGMTVTNADTGSSQKIFKTIKIGGTTFEAGSNTDTLELVASGGISLTSDTTNKKVTINSADPDYTLSGFTDAGTSVYLSTTTDNLGLGTTTPSYKLDVTGTGHFTSNLTLDGDLSVDGNVTLGDSSSDTLTFLGKVANGTGILPFSDLGADLGSSGFRFNNLWVANINSNSSQAFSGQTTFSYPPTDTTISEASVLINPASSVANGQLLGFGIAGYQRALIDEDGDLILGYSDATSAPTSDYPLNVYGHSGTRTAYLDTSGNLNITGGYSIAGTSVLSATTLGSGILSSSLTAVGALSSGSITTGFGAIDTGADAIVTTGTIGSAGLTAFTGNTLAINSISSTGDISIIATGGNVGIGTATPTQTLTVLGDLASSVAVGVEGLKLTDTTDVTKMAMKWTSSGINMDIPGLATTNKLTNGTFETDITTGGWNQYTLNDQFTTDRSAGAVNGTSAEPTGGTRTVVDTNSKLSISSSQLSFATGGSAAGNPGLSYPIITRGAGKILVGKINISTVQAAFGWGTDASSYIEDSFTFTDSLYARVNQNTVTLGSFSTGTDYYMAIIMRTTGYYWYIKGGAFTNWTLMHIDSTITGNKYPRIITENTTSVFTADNIRIPTSLWLPTPLSYDTFTRGDGAIGSSETTGPDSQTTPSLAWTGGAISSNKNVITPSLGSELWDADAAAFTSGTYAWTAYGTNTIENDANSLKITYVDNQAGALEYLKNSSDLSADMTTGLWYTLNLNTKVNAGTSVRIGVNDGISLQYGRNETATTFTPYVTTFRARQSSSAYMVLNGMGTGEIFWIDDLSVKPLTLSSLFSSVSTSDADVIADANVTLTAGTQAGLVTNLDSTSTPANFLIAYHDGTNVKLDKNVAGTYTNLISAAATYSAGATLRVITYTSSGSLKVRVYYNNALVGSEQTVSDAGIISNTKHGLFSTYSGNTFDNFTLWARGTGNEYVNLPDTDLTATRDTSVYYTGSSSLKLVAGTSDNGYTQAYTLPDTSNYTLSAFVYTNGSAVTSSDLSLENGDVNLTTTYTSVGNGWYKLSASFTGVTSSRNYGVKVKAGRTVYVDNLSLFASSGSGNTLAIGNSTTGLGGLSVESTTTLNSGLASLQALIVKGFSGQTANLQEWQDSTGTVLGSISPTGALTSAGNLDINGTVNDMAGALNLSGNSLTSSGALTITPSAGNNLNIVTSAGGQLAINTNQLAVDSTTGRTGIGTIAPSAKLHIIATTEQLRLGYDSSNYWSNTVGTTGGLTMQGVGTGGSLTLSPTSGQNLNISLATTGDMVVNTNDLVVDTSLGYIGINTTAPTALLDLAGTSGTDAFRLTNAGTKVLGLSYATNSTIFDQTSTDPTNKLLNSTFDSDLTSWSEVPSYTLNDQFTTDRSAGAVNGTQAEPTGGTRTVTDTNSKLSITGGQLSFATGGVTDGNPGLLYSVVTRGAGKIVTGALNVSSGQGQLGWNNTTSGRLSDGFFLSGGTLNIQANGTAIATGVYVAGTSYQLTTVMRTTGAYYYIKGGTFTDWTLLYINSTGSGNLYPAVGTNNTTSVATADNIRIPTSTWLPTPLAYDTFTRGDGAIGNSETTGPDSQTTPSLAWTGGAISTNKNVITPSSGSELVTNGGFDTDTTWTKGDGWTISGGTANASTTGNSNISQGAVLTVGNWYQATLNITSLSGSLVFGDANLAAPVHTTTGTKTVTSRTTTDNIRARAIGTTTAVIDDYSVKALTLSSLFSTVSTSDSDVIADAGVTLTAGTQAGLVLNLDSTSSPANFIIVYHDGTSVKVDEAVAGVYTNKQSTTVTYSAGATLRAIREGTKLRVYYNNALVGAELTMTANTATIHGLFSTYSGNSFDNFTLWARGTGAEYTGAPFEELTATRNTTTKYNNSTASVQLVTTGTDANYLQSVNVGDTSTYNLIAYAYTTGAAVTTADLNLYYDTAELTTAFTPMGGTGWYKLTGSFTGVASAKDYGVRVKAGKTVYVDEMHLQVGTGTTQNMYVLNSATGVTGLNVQGLVNGTLNGIATYSKAGTISDSDFGGGVAGGLMGIDTTNHRLYFREGASWSYIARTGGFQIPEEEARIQNLEVSDYLIPYVESRMSDGAIHGLYKKLSDVVFDGLTVTGDTTLGDAIITGSLLVNDINSPLTINIQQLALAGIDFVGGNIKFTKEGLIYGNDLIRGKTTIPAETAEVNVTMNWEESPKSINVTPEFSTKAWVENLSKDGFIIHTSNSPTTESGVLWQAVW